MILIAHNIRSLHNVGSLFRSADVFGIEKIFLTGFTGCPPRKEIHKTALGSEFIIPWEFHGCVQEVIQSLKSKQYRVYGLETIAEATIIKPQEHSEKLALLIGNEVSGIEEDLFVLFDGCFVIPMIGRKKSLNVSIAASIAMYVFQSKNMLN